MENKTTSNIVITILMFLMLIASLNAAEYNSNGDFTVGVEYLQKTVFNEDIEANYQIIVTNNLNTNNQISINIPEIKGWDIEVDNTLLNLNSQESQNININIKTNSQFDYSTSVVSNDIIIISQKENYIGSFDFPASIQSKNDDVSLIFRLDIEKKEKLNEIYSSQFSTNAVSPETPLRFSIQSENVEDNQDVEVVLEFAKESFAFKDSFSKEQSYKIYEQEIPSSIDPGLYSAQVTIRLLKGAGVVWEFKNKQDIEVNAYNELVIDETFKRSLLKETITLNIENKGNIKESFQREVDMNFLEELILFGTADQQEFISTDNGVIFSENLAKGESIQIVYYYNYIPLYVILIVIATIGIYIYYRKNSNPLDVETKIYQIKKIRHEGVKSMKVRIGFENIKEAEIEQLKIIFRMPGYLNVKENSFLLTEPNQVLKGRTQFKLTWDFKRFEKNDTRIVGFSLVNKRGILGDVKIPPLEIEAKINGKIKRYYKSFPIIRG